MLVSQSRVKECSAVARHLINLQARGLGWHRASVVGFVLSRVPCWPVAWASLACRRDRRSAWPKENQIGCDRWKLLSERASTSLPAGMRRLRFQQDPRTPRATWDRDLWRDQGSC